MDCPWCGCGYLFSCLSCGKAFTFARCEEVGLEAEDIVAIDYERFFGDGRKCPKDKIEKYAADLRLSMSNLKLGSEYVILDTHVIEVAERAYFTGEYGKHLLDVLPQVEHRSDKKALISALERPYWTRARSRKLAAPSSLMS